VPAAEGAPAEEPAPADEPVAEEAPPEAPVPADEPVAEEPVAEEPVAEEAPEEEPSAETAEAVAPADEGIAPPEQGDAAADDGGDADAAAVATDEAATEQPRGPQRGPKKKGKRVPRSQRHKHAKPKREKRAQREPITRLPRPEGERGRDQQRRGVVVSAAADKTIVVRVDSIKAHPKYKKVIRRSKKFHAHDEQNQAKAGDVVRIVETRPLSKTKRWRLAEIIEVAK
jgi:ribosomal protein uS17